MEIIFVHLGPAKAKHLWLNIQRINRLFPHLEITVILSEKSHLNELQSIKVKVFMYERPKILEKYILSLSHNAAFRSGFWIFSLERFFALHSWHMENISKSFLHIESDILIMPNFPWDNFNKIQKLAWCRFNEVEDVASFVYSPNLKSTEWLVSQLKEQILANNDSTDMSALGTISNHYDIYILPRLEGENDIKRTDKDSINHESQDFYGIFDEATIGMWLIGQDPRNNFGISRKYRVLSHADIDPSKYTFCYTSKNGLVATNNGKDVSIYNLHVHSKKLVLFGKHGDIALKIDVLLSKYRFLHFTFSLKALVATMREYFSRNRLISKGTYLKIYKIFLHK